MLQRLKDLFGIDVTSNEDSARRLQLAAAALLLEMSKADYQRDIREQQAIVSAIRNTYRLDETAIAELLNEASGASDRATSLFEFTSVINENCSEQEKYDLVRELWRVAHADGNIDKYEEHLLGKIADLVYLPRSLYIRAKLSVLNT
ncbi:MAG TPA: TerB family tellurite resistance protein [Spongiibacteraceae bacterium]|nr:TerB family tellurite resistance protein [Spongiibacteraceae bacterium]